MRTLRDAYPGAQTCCALKSSAPSGARQDNYADSGSACKLAAGHGPDGAHANRFAYPAVEKFCRATSAGPPKNFRTLYGLKWATSVEKRHRLPISEALRCPRERIKFSLERISDSVVLPFACPAVEKFCRASSAGGRLNLQTNSFNRIVSVAEDCLSPAGSFHGCSLMHCRGCFRHCSRAKKRPQDLLLRSEFFYKIRQTFVANYFAELSGTKLNCCPPTAASAIAPLALFTNKATPF